jgi:uncharacterized iron-regulated protein
LFLPGSGQGFSESLIPCLEWQNPWQSAAGDLKKDMGIFHVLLCVATILPLSAGAKTWNGRIEEGFTGTAVSISGAADRLADSDFVVLGEQHDVPAIQNAQAAMIAEISGRRGDRTFSTAWEFLDAKDQPRIQEAFEAFNSGSIDSSEFLVRTQGSARYKNYAPILEVTRLLGGGFLGVNLSRQDKEPVVRGGLGAALPGTVPSGFGMEFGGYFERFKKAMEGHATPEQISNYYAAQCLTDDVMAFHLIQSRLGSELRFLVVGGFHSDFGDGVVKRLRLRSGGARVRTLRFVDASLYTESELRTVRQDPVYGIVADFIYYLNEPKAL